MLSSLGESRGRFSVSTPAATAAAAAAGRGRGRRRGSRDPAAVWLGRDCRESVLSISSVRPSDARGYLFAASNERGRVEFTVTLEVSEERGKERFFFSGIPHFRGNL